MSIPVVAAPPPSGPVAEVGGVNVHAKVAIEAADRARLEQLCRYTARPPLSSERLELHHDGAAGLVRPPPQLHRGAVPAPLHQPPRP
ncbi:MAG: transposase [Myxococcota bacterium]